MKKICHFWRQFLSLICCIWASARCWLEPACRVKCEGNKNKSFVALTRGNSINKTRPFPADILIVLQRLPCLCPYCSRASCWDFGSGKISRRIEGHQASVDLQCSWLDWLSICSKLCTTLAWFHISVSQLSLNIDTMHVLCHLSLCKHSQSRSDMFLVHVTKDRQVILRS